MKPPLLISRCLLGENVRYDGLAKPLPADILSRLEESFHLVPVCPEIMGGLVSPREPSEIRNGRVYSRSGEDLTDQFFSGARKAVDMASKKSVGAALFKENSPSCGSRLIYNGEFSGEKIPGMGITAGKLKDLGIRVYSEEQIEELFQSELSGLS